MSHLCLKLLALVIMTIDHIGFVWGKEGWNFFPFDSDILRCIGRISFPLFAFCLAQGWKMTRNRKRYFQNLACGALASQIPFSMAFSAANFLPSHNSTVYFHLSWQYLFFMLVATGVYWHFVLHNHYRRDILLIALTAFLPGVQLKIGGFWVLHADINIFYTFLVATFCLYIVAGAKYLKKSDRIVLLLSLPVLLLGYGFPADYGSCLVGVLLIVGFFIIENKHRQATFLIMWSILFYGVLVGNIASTFSCSLASGFILLYDPSKKSRFRLKRLFYWYYPLHLFILGIINLGIRYFMLT